MSTTLHLHRERARKRHHASIDRYPSVEDAGQATGRLIVLIVGSVALAIVVGFVLWLHG